MTAFSTDTQVNNLWSTNSLFLQQLKVVLEKNYQEEELDISVLAKHLNKSERQLYRKTKAEIGKTPNQMIIDFRLEKAMELVYTGNYLTVQEIVFAVGYKNNFYFSQLFEKAYGETPMDALKRLGFR